MEKTKEIPESNNRALGFTKEERLYHRRILENVFQTGTPIKDYPFILLHLKTPLYTTYPAQCAVTASKRNFKRAVDRNRIKRLMREAWRTQKSKLYEALQSKEEQRAIVIMYVGKELPDFALVSRKITSLVNRLKEDIVTLQVSTPLPDKKDEESTS